MSRYRIEHTDPHLSVTVGWDTPMQTYFGMVVDDRIPEEEDDCVLWVGQQLNELPTTGALYEAMLEWIQLDGPTLRQLAQDRDTSPPLTPLQRHMRAILRQGRSMPLLIGSTLLGLSLQVLFPSAALALDAETQRLEQAVLCQTLAYRPECGGPGVTPPKPTTPRPTPVRKPETPPVRPVEAPPALETTKPGKEDFLRAATWLCLGDLPRLQSWAPSATRTEVMVACVRAYLAREGHTLP